MINFELEHASDEALVAAIAKRAVLKYGGSQMHWHMNIAACHLNACRLRLADLLDADDFNFSHDVLGIDKCLDRETGILLNRFWPGYAR